MVGTSCAVINCVNRSGRDRKKFFRIPSIISHQGERTQELSTRRRNAWLTEICRKFPPKQNLDYLRVCSDHFHCGKPSQLYDETNPDWGPTLLMGYEKKHGNASVERYSRLQNRRKRKADTDKPDLDMDVEIQEVESVTEGTFVQTDITMEDINHLEQQKENIAKDYSERLLEIHELRESLTKLQFTENSLTDEKVSFYTGLKTVSLLMCLFDLVRSEDKENSNRKLTPFQEFAMTLMRLRHNFPVQELAYKFQVSSSSASRIVNKWIDILYFRLKWLIQWPTREALWETMPISFQENFGKRVAAIIDCFEIYTEKPSTLLAQASLWSQYKHHHTVKLLIGITPQGTISFISKAYGGSCSDKFVTEDSGFLNMLLPKDLILADRGFDIKDQVKLFCAEINTLSSLNNQRQLSSLQVESTRKTANVRIHVERVIGELRNRYRILRGILPVDFLLTSPACPVPKIDKIVTICSALVNLKSNSIVPKN